MKEDTTWTMIRWCAAIWVSRMALRLAPAGTAKARWALYNQLWAREVSAAWDARYGKNTVDNAAPGR